MWRLSLVSLVLMCLPRAESRDRVWSNPFVKINHRELCLDVAKFFLLVFGAVTNLGSCISLSLYRKIGSCLMDKRFLFASYVALFYRWWTKMLFFISCVTCACCQWTASIRQNPGEILKLNPYAEHRMKLFLIHRGWSFSSLRASHALIVSEWPVPAKSCKI